MKKCKFRRCDKMLTGRKQYCDDHCKWWENDAVRQENKGKPPKYKRTKDWIYMVTGAQPNSLRGQGRRSGGMVKGGMGARVMIMTEDFVPTTQENLLKHFNHKFALNNVRFGDDTYMTRTEFNQLKTSQHENETTKIN